MAIVEPGGRGANRRDDEPSPYCCTSCSDLFFRPPGKEDVTACPRCAEEGKAQDAEAAEANARIRPAARGVFPPRRPPKRPDPANPRALIRPPKDAPLNLAEAGRLRKERISALNARLRSLQASGKGDGEMAQWLRSAILYQQGQGPKPGPQPGRGGKGRS